MFLFENARDVGLCRRFEGHLPTPACATLWPDGLVSHAHSKGGTTSTSPATRTPRTSGATGGIVKPRAEL